MDTIDQMKLFLEDEAIEQMALYIEEDADLQAPSEARKAVAEAIRGLKTAPPPRLEGKPRRWPF